MILLDASVAFKWYVQEEGSDEALRLMSEGDDLGAPELVLAETANALWKIHRHEALPTGSYGEAVRTMADNFEQLYPLEPLITRAAEIARNLDHPIYDCVYLACAERQEVDLITADQRLLKTVVGTAWEPLCRSLVSSN